MADVTRNNGADLGNASTNAFSASYTVSSNSNRFLLVGIVGDTNGGHDDITSVSYNGVAMSLIDKQISGNPNRYTYLYGLANPASGSHTVAVNCSNSHFLAVGAADYYNANSTIDNHAPNISSGGSNSYGSSLTPVADRCMVICFSGGYSADGGDPTGTGRFASEGSFGTWGFFDSGSVVTPAASFTITAHRSSSANPIVNLMVSLAPPGGGTTYSSSCSLAATAGVSTSGTGTLKGSSTLAATAGVATAGSGTFPASSSLAATAGISTSAGTQISVSFTLGATAALSTSVTARLPASASIAASPDFVASAILRAAAAVSLDATADVALGTQLTAVANVSLSAMPSVLSAVPGGSSYASSASLDATAGIAFSATLIAASSISLNLTPQVVAAAAARLVAGAAIAGTPLLSASPAVIMRAAIALAISGSMRAAFGGAAKRISKAFLEGIRTELDLAGKRCSPALEGESNSQELEGEE